MFVLFNCTRHGISDFHLSGRSLEGALLVHLVRVLCSLVSVSSLGIFRPS